MSGLQKLIGIGERLVGYDLYKNRPPKPLDAEEAIRSRISLAKYKEQQLEFTNYTVRMYLGRVFPLTLIGLSALLKCFLPPENLEGLDIADKHFLGAVALHSYDWLVFSSKKSNVENN